MLREVRGEEYSALYSNMKRDFPANELQPFFAVKRNLERRVFEGFFIMDSGDKAGYAIVTAPRGNGYALLHYFAVSPKMRGRGCGSEALKIITRRYSERSIILEAEDPAAAKNAGYHQTALRRIRFYERGGFRALPTSRAKIFGVDMIIMTNSPENPESVRELLHALYLPGFDTKERLRFIDIIDF